MARVRLGIRHMLVFVALAALGLRLDTIPAGWACGAFPLQVELKVPAGRRVVAVAAGSEGSVECAESWISSPGGPYTDLDAVPWVAGSPFAVRVPCGSRISWLSGRELAPWQYRALVLHLEYADGSNQWLVRPIPDHRSTQYVVVEVP